MVIYYIFDFLRYLNAFHFWKQYTESQTRVAPGKTILNWMKYSEYIKVSYLVNCSLASATHNVDGIVSDTVDRVAWCCMTCVPAVYWFRKLSPLYTAFFHASWMPTCTGICIICALHIASHICTWWDCCNYTCSKLLTSLLSFVLSHDKPAWGVARIYIISRINVCQ